MLEIRAKVLFYTFTKLRKDTIMLRHVCLSVCLFVYPSIRPSAYNNSALIGQISMKFDT